METLERLRGRIDAAEGLLDVVRTMKSLSAVYVRQYDEAAAALDGYARTVEQGFQILLHRHPELTAWARVPDEGGVMAALLFGSEHGLCGRFNEELADHALAQLDTSGVPRESWRLFAVGPRMAGLLDAEGIPAAGRLELPQSVDALAERARDALLTMEERRRESGFARIVLFHQRSERETASAPRPVTVPLLPIDADWLRRQEEAPWPTRMLPTFRIAPPELLASLVRERVLVALHAAFVESLAAENAARLRAMQAGERNVEDRLSKLQASYHHRRQESITGELLDVTVAFEVLRDRD